jgi:tetratricopeptide (TPR) repeat protein
MWRDAAAIHQLKIAFVDALQRFVRAQAGTFGDEADDLRQSLAAMRTALSEWTLAIQQFQSRSSRVGRDAETEIAMATIWLDRHRIDSALLALDRAEQRDTGRVDLHTLRALAFGAADRWDEAARALRRANRPAPFERVDLLRQVSGVAPIFPAARYAAGFAALETGDYETALARFDDAVSGDPMLASSADTHARGGHIGEASGAVVAIQSDHRIAAAGDVLARRAVDDQRVEIAIVVVIEERGAVAVGVDDEVLGGASGDVEEVEAGLSGDVHEPDRGALRAGGSHPQCREGGGCSEPGDARRDEGVLRRG